MVHTRGQGARPEGFSEYQPARRERTVRSIRPLAPSGPLYVAKRAYASADAPLILFAPTSDVSAQTQVETREISTQTEPKYKDASTQTGPQLTFQSRAVPQSAKRRREVDEDADHSASKRRKAVTPDQPKFLFSKNRNRSLLTSAPPKLSSRHESPYFDRVIEPSSPDSSPVEKRTRPSSQERVRPQQPTTPGRTATQVGIFGSVRKIFGYLRGSSQGPAQNEEQSQQSGLSDHSQDTTAAEEAEEVADLGSVTPSPQRITYEPVSPTPEPGLKDSKIFTREYFKRRRTANTIAGREQLAAMGASTEDRAEDFNPASTPGTSKRKLVSVNGHIPGPKGGGFGIDDSYLDVDNEVEGIGESSLADTEPATPTNKRPPPQTPLRSALRQRQTGTNFGTIGRKSVRINSIPTSAKAVYGQYGPSGDYRGSTFADISSQSSADSPSSLAWDVKGMHSPATIENTYNNTPAHGIDPTITDPNDETWRPSAANPRPGQFVLPDFDDDEDESEISTSSQATGTEDLPAQPPSTPRMSHAELPQTSTIGDLSGLTGHTDSIMMNETQEIIRLNKARSEAQKYKPAKSSRLSLSEARSRSSSPPGSDADFAESQIETGTPEPFRGRTATSYQDSPIQLTAASEFAVSREGLDNTTVGEDGMTAYEREHQYDAWAEELFSGIPTAPAPQTYVEAGIASSYVENLVQKTWTERDTRESVEFWMREFDEGLKAAHEAEEQGRELRWITDPDEIVELEQSVVY